MRMEEKDVNQEKGRKKTNLGNVLIEKKIYNVNPLNNGKVYIKCY